MNRKAAKVFIVFLVFIIGFSMLPLAVNAFYEKMDWNTYAMAYQFSCTYVTQIPVDECDALVAIYNNTNGAKWKDHSGWLVSVRPNDWYGVTVIANHVRGLQLTYNNLSGSMPSKTIGLTYLQVLDLDWNRLTVPSGYPRQFNLLDQFLYGRDPNWHLRQYTSKSIGPSGGKFSSLDGLVTLTIPSGALSADATFELMPMPAPEHPTGGLFFGQNAFSLVGSTAVGAGVVFKAPVSLTIAYDPTSLNLPEDTLRLFFYNPTSSQWEDAATSCIPPFAYSRDLEGNKFTVQICHLSEYAVLSDAVRYFLPSILR